MNRAQSTPAHDGRGAASMPLDRLRLTLAPPARYRAWPRVPLAEGLQHLYRVAIRDAARAERRHSEGWRPVAAACHAQAEVLAAALWRHSRGRPGAAALWRRRALEANRRAETLVREAADARH